MIRKKIKLLIVLALVGFPLSIMSNTYSRYVADTTGDVEMAFAKWQILVNDSDIANSNATSIEIMPTILENDNVAKNKLAPTSKGYFDIVIDPTAVQVSFNYHINILNDEDMADLIIDKYAIIDSDTNLDELEYKEITNNEIIDSYDYQQNEDFAFKPFTVRVFFEWYDENDNDSLDTEISNTKANFTIKTNIKFEQKIKNS